MEAIFGSTSTLVGLILSLSVLILGIVLAFGASSVASAARKTAEECRRSVDAARQMNKDAEHLVGALRELIADLRQEVSELRAGGRGFSTAGPKDLLPANSSGTPAPVGGPTTVAVLAPQTELVPSTGLGDGDESGDTWVENRSDAVAGSSADVDSKADATVMLGKSDLSPKPRDDYHGMPILRLTAGLDRGKEFRLPFDRTTIGRAPTNRVVLTEDKASRIHAEILYENNRFTLKDNNSTNGTVRNGAPVAETPLEFGDVITVGKTEMLFTCEGFDLKGQDDNRAIFAFERMLQRQPDFVAALQNLAFLLERDVARRGEAQKVWDLLQKLEK